MATNAIKYISNVGKSMGYATVDVLKEMNPSVTSFIDTNNDALKTTYSAIKNIKSTSKSIYDKAVISRYGELAKNLKKNIFEDIKTGKIYNKERVEKAESAAAMNMLGADEDFDFSFDDDSSSDDDFDFGNDDLMNKMDDVGEKTSTAISTVVARSAEYQVRATKELGNVIYNQNASIYAGLHANMKTINENISTLINFASGPMQTHLENSKTFYETETRLSEERNSILKEMLELQKAYYNKPQTTKTNSSSRMRISDVVDSDGMVDFSQYFKAIKQNAKRNSSGTGDMIDMLFESGAIDSMIASPLEFIAKGAVKSLMPKMLKKSMEEFNKVLSGAFSSLMMNISKMDDYGPTGVIKNLFGIDVAEKKKIDTGKYEKGAVPFDGITRKSIVEVIPTYLSQIASALTGMQETRYDYESGKFVDIKDIQKMLDLKNQRYSEQANYDLKEEIQKYTKSLDYEKSGIDKKQFEKDLQKILDDSYKNGKLFNSRDSKNTSKDYGLSGGKKSDLNLEVIREIFERIGQNRPGTPIQWAGNMQSTKDYQFRDMEQEEASGTSLLAALYNDSIKKSKSSSSSKKSAAAPGRKSIYSDIYDEVVKIRKILESRRTDEPKKKSFVDKILHKDSKQESRDTKKSTEKAANKSQSTTQKTKEKVLDNKDALDIAKASFDKVDAEDDSKVSSSFKSIFDEVQDANTASGKFKALLKVPGRFVSILLKKGQNNIYDMIFGKPEDKKSKFRKEIDELGLGPAIMGRLSKVFTNFNNWLKEHILNPLKERFNFDNIKKFFGDLFGRLGLKEKFNNVKNKAKDKTENFRERFSSSIKNPFKRAKNKASDTIKEFVTDEGASVRERNEKIQEALNNLHGAGKIDNAAKGIRRVSKTGVVAVSEGEMIIPASLNPFDIKKNIKKENKAKEDFISNFAEGGFVNDEDIDKFSNLANRIAGDKKYSKELKQYLYNKLEKSKKDINNKKNWKSRDILGESIDYLGKGILNLADEINRLAGGDKKSKDKDKDINKEKEGMLSTAFGELKKFAPEAAAGGVIGAGVSFLPGIIGGPVLGAAVGAGVSLISHSDKIKKMLFGDENDKGLLPENISKNIQKYGKSMGIGAIAGSLGGLLHIIPGGPVAGVILGSAIGFAKNNDKIQEKLFGEKGLLGKNFKDKVKKSLPGMGAGALVGALAGPFGIGTNILLGSAVGFATTTDTFKDAFFGKVDEKTGEREGGVFKNMVDNLILPLKDFAFETKDKMADWSNKYIMQPLKDSVDPMKKQMELMFKDITGFFKGAIDRVFDDKIGTPFEKFLRDKIFKPSTKFIGGALSPIKFVASLPGRGLTAASNHVRTKHVNTGNATYMTAAQRLLYRHSVGNGITGRRFKKGDGDSFREYDKSIYNMTDDQISSTKDILSDILDKEKQVSDFTNNDSYDQFDATIRRNKDLNYKNTKKIIKQIKKVIKGSKSPDDAVYKVSKLIAKTDLPENERREIAQAANQYIASISEQLKAKSEISNKKKVVMNKLGIKDESHLPKFLDLLKAEDKKTTEKLVTEDLSKSPEERFNDWEEVRHDETISKLGQIRDSIMALSISDPEAKKKFLDKSMKRYNAIDKEVTTRKDFIKKVKEAVKEEKLKVEEEKKEKKDRKNAKNKGWKNKKLGNKTINWRNTDDYDPLTGRRLDSQVDDTGNVNTSSEAFKLSAKMKNKAKEAYYTFYESKPIRFIRDSKGKLTKDTGDSETRKTVDSIEREKTEKRKFFENGIPLFSAIKDKFFGKRKNKSEDEDDEDNKTGFFGKLFRFLTGKSKIGKLAKAAGLIFGVPLLIGVWKDTIWPGIKNLFEPLQPAIDGVKEGLSTVWDKAKSWIGEQAPKFGDYILSRWTSGFTWILTEAIPKATEVLLSNLPSILGKLAKAIVDGLGTSIRTIFNKVATTKKSTDELIDGHLGSQFKSTNIASSTSPSYVSNEDNSYIKSLFSKFKSSSSSNNNRTTTTPTGITVNNGTQSLNNTSVVSTNYNQNQTQQGVQYSNYSYEDYTNQNTNSNASSSQTQSQTNNVSTYEAVHNMVNGSSQNRNIATSTSKKSKTIKHGYFTYTIDPNVTLTLQDGRVISVEDFLKTSNIVIAYDNNGTPVTGKNILDYPDEAVTYLGVSYTIKDQDEIDEDTDEMLGTDSKDHKSIKGAIGEFILRSFLKGKSSNMLTLAGKGIKATGKLVGKIPILGTKLASLGLRGVGKATETVGKIGGKAGELGEKLIWKRGSQKVAEKGAEEGAEKAVENSYYSRFKNWLSKKAGKEAAEEGVEETVENAGKETAEKAIQETAEKAGKETAEKVVEQGTKNTAEEAIKQSTKNTAEKLANEEAKASAEKYLENSAKGVTSILTNEKTVSFITTIFTKYSKEEAEALGKKIAKKVIEKLFTKTSDTLIAKISEKIIEKASSAALSAGLINVASAITVGLANSTVNATATNFSMRTKDVTPGLRFISFLFAAISDYTIVPDIIGKDKVINVFIDIFKDTGLIGKKLLDSRQEVTDITNKVQDKYGVNISTSETATALQKDNWLQKTKLYQRLFGKHMRVNEDGEITQENKTGLLTQTNPNVDPKQQIMINKRNGHPEYGAMTPEQYEKIHGKNNSSKSKSSKFKSKGSSITHANSSIAAGLSLLNNGSTDTGSSTSNNSSSSDKGTKNGKLAVLGKGALSKALQNLSTTNTSSYYDTNNAQNTEDIQNTVSDYYSNYNFDNYDNYDQSSIDALSNYSASTYETAGAVGTELDMLQDSSNAVYDHIQENVADYASSSITAMTDDRNDLFKYYKKGNLVGFWKLSSKFSDSEFFSPYQKTIGYMNRMLLTPFYYLKNDLKKINEHAKKLSSSNKTALEDFRKRVLNALGLKDSEIGDATSSNSVSINTNNSYSSSSSSTSSSNTSTSKGEKTSGVTSAISKAGDIIKNAEKDTVNDNNTYPGEGSGILSTYGDELTKSESKNGTFISQLDYDNKFNTSKDTTTQTLADSGCAPASAAMVINGMSGSGTEMTMGDAAVTALNYKQKNSGVTADYFGDIFAQNGIRSQYITQNSPGSRNANITNNLRNNNKVVLMGEDSSNTSKKNSPFGPNSHYVVANGISNDGNYMYINDPESNTPNRKYSTKKVLSGTKMGIAASIGGKASGIIRKSLKRFSGRGSISASQYMHENLGSWSPITVDEMAAWINRVSSTSSPWRNNKEAAKVFVDAGNQSGLDPRYILAHAAVESGWGTSKISRDKNNYFGIGAFDSSPYASAYSFGSGLAAGIIGGAKWIRKNYYDAGQTTVYLMNNDPTGKGHNYATAGMSWINSISQIMASGPENKKFSTDKKSCAGAMNDSSSSSTSDSSSSSNGGTLVDKILSGFSKMAEAFGLTSSSDSVDTSSSSGISGGSDKQKALVQKMKSVEGKLAYSQTQRNPDTGSGDCSSTVQWAYKNVLGVDPGSWTGAQETDSDLYTVAEGANICIADESKLQPGDLVLYRKGNTSTHVEMYAGDGKLIGHGGGPHGTTKGPTIKPLNTKFSSTPVMVRRWVGFKGGSGSGLDTASYSQTNNEIKNGTFISQLDYDNKFNTSKDTTSQTLADSGCAPASAAMVLNSFKNADNKRVTMQQASAPALKYKVENGGVTADYFGDMFEKNGLQSRYIMDSNPNTRATNIATSLYNDNKVVLMGEDSSNTSKKNSPFGPNAHYVVATKMSPDGKYIYINDPESKKPEVAYPAQNVLSSAQIGIAASAANGSGLIKNALKKYSGRGSYGPGTIQYKVWTKIRGAGYNEIATAALMGNIQHESGFNASAIEKGNGVGLGLIQWSYGRRTALENYAKSKGKSASDVDIQIEYLLKELDAGSGIWTNASSRYGFGSLSRNDWANGKDIEKATKAFMCCFERPSYSASVNHIDKRIQSAKEYLQAFAGISGDSSSSSDSDSSNDSSSTTTTSFIDKVLSGFTKLASAWGVGAIEDTSSTDSSSSSSSSISGGSDKQQALVDKMKSVQGKLKYSNTQRNPDTGSGDCSSTVQWAYQKVLGVDPGSTTMDQEVDSDLYTVSKGYDSCISDESKLQPGDLILYRRGGQSWHVEMYAGNGQIIGHGGGPHGTKMGPVINKLHTNMGSTPYMVRRWVGFKGGSGSGLDTGTFDSDGAFSKQTLRKAQSNDWIVNNQQKVSIKDISKFKERQINAKASLYSGSGSNIAPGRSSTQRLRSNTDLSNIMQALAFNSTSRTSGDSTSNALLNIVSLLTQIVDNTSNLKAMVSLLSEIISIMNEESTTPKTKENEQKIQALSSKKESLFSKLNSYSGENESVSQLIQNAERLARV